MWEDNKAHMFLTHLVVYYYTQLKIFSVSQVNISSFNIEIFQVNISQQ